MTWGYEYEQLTWDGEPVTLRNCVVERSHTWRGHSGESWAEVTVVFENGWDCEVRLAPLAFTPDADFGTLTVFAGNRRAIAERQALEEAAAERGDCMGRVGDRWDFSYTKSGYENPGAYVQWWMLHPDGDDEWTIDNLAEEGQSLPIDTPDELQQRIDQVAGMASDPTDRSGYPEWAREVR